MNFSTKAFLILLVTFTSSMVSAKVFQTNYLSFQIPNSWNCSLEAQQWVCKQSDQSRVKEAMIIMSAKQAGPEDNLANFQKFLKQPKMVNIPGKPPKNSKVVKVETYNLRNHTWISGTHLGSEIPNYYTQYLVTVKENLSILISMTAHAPRYKEYNEVYQRIIASIRLAQPKAIKQIVQQAQQRNGNQGGQQGGQAPTPVATSVESDGQGSQKSNMFLYIVIGLMAIVAMAYFLTRK